MDISLYQAASAMNASSRWQEVIAENLAASQIPGFKKQDLSFSAVQAGQHPPSRLSSSWHNQRFIMPLADTTTNLKAGEIRPTGVNTDLALEGPGFFEVQMPDGRSGYTRDGGFHVNGQGQLVNKQGLPVLGESGSVMLDPNNPGPIVVSPTGDISQGGVVKGRLKLMEFSDPAALSPAGGGMFVAADSTALPSPSSRTTVHQGFVENSNTSTVTEMVNLINANRLFQANQKVILTADERVSRLINDVGNPPA